MQWITRERPKIDRIGLPVVDPTIYRSESAVSLCPDGGGVSCGSTNRRYSL